MTELTRTDSLISTVAGGSPLVQALDLAYVKLHIRALGDADDALLRVYIDAAAAYFEGQSGRQLLTATREMWLDAFPFLGASGIAARIELPHPPLQHVVSVAYVDGAGVVQTLGGSPAVVHASAPAGPYATRGSVEPIAGGSWPIARVETGAVRIRYTCGYGDTAAAIPPLVRQILCYLVGHFDTFRSAVHEARKGQVLELPYGVQALLDGFKYTALSSQVLRTQALPDPGVVWP
jgi:uncharacterized phiE125 gp8 family phage protein